MKKNFILICALLALATAGAQCPKFVAFDTTVCGTSINKTIDATVLESQLCGDSITIIFDDSLTTLNGATKVYLHSAPQFYPFEAWPANDPYTVDTGTSTAGLMTRIGAHLWSIRFNPRTYYGYSPDSCLNAIVLGFRDSTYAHYVKDGSNDIYIYTALDSADITCTCSFFTATYTHSTNIIYRWSDNNTSGIRTFTTGGSYTVTATGIGGCTASGYVDIILDSSRVSIGDDTIECTTSSYTFVATPGYRTYQWLDAAATGSNTHGTSVLGGTYWVQATDSLGCVSRDTATVHLSATGYLSLPDTISSCPGIPVSADASAAINYNGDSLVITYDATRGLTQLVGDTNVYFFSAPQLYSFQQWGNSIYTTGSFTQNDGVGRMTSLGNNKWQITIDPQSYYRVSPDSPILGIWMVFRNYNGTKTGKDSNTANSNNIYLYTVANPPTSPSDEVTGYHKSATVSYSWSNSVHTPADTFTTGGTYYVTVTDGVCTHTDSVVASFASSGHLYIGADTTVCAATDSVILSAGAGYAHYHWSTGDTTASALVSPGATYTLTATTGTGCVSTGQRKVSVSISAVYFGPDLVPCTNAPVVLTATPGFASYTFLDRAPSDDTLTVTHSGSYWVAATDSFGCTSYDTATVRYSDVLLATLPDTVSSCPGHTVTLNAGASIQAHGDSITIFYDATQGQTGLVGDSVVYFYSAPQLYPFQAWGNSPYTTGSYNLNNGVGRMDSLGNNRWSITIYPQSYYRVSPDSPIIGIWMIFRNSNGSASGRDINGNNIFLNIATTPPYSTFSGVTATRTEAGTMAYAWSNSQATPSVTVSTTGSYTVTVSDGTCSHAVSTYVNLTGSIAVNIGNDTSICPSGSVTFDPGAGYAHYLWSNGDTTEAITVSAAGSYSVIVTDSSGCIGYDTAAVVVRGTKVNAGPDVTRCNSRPVTLTASGGYVSYYWFDLGASSQTYSAVNDGCYWVEAVDGGGCTSFDTVCVSTSGVEGLHEHDTLSTCAGGSATFDASVNVNASGDSLVITFNALANTNSANLLGATKVYMHSAPQFYPFASWPGNDPYTVGHWGQDDGVGEMDSIGPNLWQITIYPSCYYHYSPDTPLNAIWMVFRNANGTEQSLGGNINLLLVGAGTPSTAYTGVTGYYKSTSNISYSWSAPASGPVASFIAAGAYYVTATDGTCTKSDTLLVNQFGNPSVSLGDDTCLGSAGTVELRVDSTFPQYLWSTGASTQDITANLTGTYWVRVTNAAGCTGSDTVTVDSSCGPHLLTGCAAIAYFRVINISTANTVTIKDSSQNAHLYSWNFGDNSSDTAAGSQVHTYASAGVYTVTLVVRSSDSCAGDTFSEKIYVNSTGISQINGLKDVNLYPNPASNTCTIDISSTQNLEVSIDVSSMLGASVQTTHWKVSTGENKLPLDLSGISSGMYTVTIRSASGTLTRKLDIIKY